MYKLYATGTTGTIGRHLPGSVEPINVDLASRQENFESIILEKNSHLLHLAGVVGPSEVLKNVDYARSVNILGTEFLAQDFMNKSKGVFYYVSTSHVYAPTSDLISETSALAPANIYAEQKREAEVLLQNIFSREPHRLCIIRLFSVLDWEVPSYTLGGAIRRMTNSEDILSNASDVRDFLTPKAIARAIYEIASVGSKFEIVNLCTGAGLSVGAAATRMLSESGFTVQENRFSWEQGANPYVVGDNSLLISHHPNLKLSWQPSTLN